MGGPEIRIDQLTGLRVILAPGRATRPDSFERPAPVAGSVTDCPFCEGHEERTPEELDAVRPEGGEPNGPGWVTRTVPNLYPALCGGGEADGEQEAGLASRLDPLRATARGAEPDLFSSGPAEGGHEVIVNAPRHETAMANLDDAQFAAAVDAWRSRMRAHTEAACVLLIVNEGPDAGASREHTHAQLYALSFVPVVVARERERFNAYHERTMGGELLTDVIAEEVRRRERLVAVDDEAVLIAPWASRSPFELRVIPRRSSPRFEAEEGTGTAMLQRALRLLAARLGGPPQLNLWVRTAPRGVEQFHWRIDIVPKLTIRAGFELGTGVDINVYPPEQAAADLREVDE